MAKKRIISAVIMLAVTVPLIILGGYAFGALVLAVSAACIFEIQRAFSRKGINQFYTAGYAFLIVPLLQVILRSDDFFTVNVKGPEGSEFSITGFILTAEIIAVLTASVVRSEKYTPADAAVTLFSGLYVTVLCSYFISVRELGDGKAGLCIFITVFLANISADTAAYAIGSKFGKHKLIPKVSPHKSVEGSVAAFPGAVVAALILGIIFIKTGVFTDIPLFWYPIFGLIIGLMAQFGDLAASLIKRFTGIKDYSDLIPGHGGVLDRIDSLMFVMPIMYYIIRLII